MRNIYTIEHCYSENNEWICTIKEQIDSNKLHPTGQVLTDSDKLAFVYLVVENDQYSYLQFPKNIWATLLKIVEKRGNIFLQYGNEKIELVDFVDEIEMLLFNIEGNGNYGETFVNAVEDIFAPILKGDNR